MNEQLLKTVCILLKSKHPHNLVSTPRPQNRKRMLLVLHDVYRFASRLLATLFDSRFTLNSASGDCAKRAGELVIPLFMAIIHASANKLHCFEPAGQYEPRKRIMFYWIKCSWQRWQPLPLATLFPTFRLGPYGFVLRWGIA